jgi:hypothetical protein
MNFAETKKSNSVIICTLHKKEKCVLCLPKQDEHGAKYDFQ